MFLFTRFLLEQEQTMTLAQPSVHVNHLEDSIIHQGHEGVHHAANYLDDAHRMLTGNKSSCHYTTKFDGSPPVIFGLHPHTGQFFVSSPKGQNKVNHTPEEIINNHANNPKLASQLIASLAELPKIMPKNSKPGEIYHGDVMHTPDSILDKDGHFHIKPNRMVYSAKHDSPHGKAAINSKLGFVTHTMYGPDGTAMPVDKKTRSRFVNHPDVHHIDPTFKPEDGNYDNAAIQKYLKARDAATKHYSTMRPESFDAVMTHAPEVVKHINDQIKKGEPYDSKSLLSALNSDHEKRMSGISSEKWGRQRISTHAAKSAHLMAHEQHIDKALKLHRHMADATHVLAESMGKSDPWIHSIEGKITPPEGHIAIAPNGTAVKFVHRKEFAKAEKKAKKSNE